MFDFLAGQPARAGTPVPGHWLLDAPAVIHVRVYSADSFIPDHPIASDTLLERLRDDPFERVWLKLNALNEAVTSSVLSTPSCVVQPASGSSGRELWVFSADESDPLAGIGVSVTETHPRPPIILIETISCSEHGNALTCLQSDQTCTPTFKPPESWKYLEAAAGEKLAWRLGSRINLLPSPVDLGEQIEVRLRPTPTKLLLTARPRPKLQCQAETRPNVVPYLLCPLGLPALHVAPHSTTSAQDARLCSAFDTSLGTGWKTGRMETRIAMQAAGEDAADWSVYFVPLEHGGLGLPSAVAARWRGQKGVLTIWPTHLAQPLSQGHRPPRPKPPVPGPGLGAPPEILDTAAGLFDFLSSYTAPEEDEEEEEEVEGPSLVDIPDPEEPTEADADADGDGDGNDEDDSVDDLFSAHSSEEVNAEEEPFPSSAFPSPRGEMDLDVDGLFEEVAALPEAPKIEVAPVASTRVSSRAVSPHFSITEDDFNFFDSPAEPTVSPVFEKVEPEPEVNGTAEAEEEAPEPIVSEEIPEIEEEVVEEREKTPERPLKRPISLGELVPEAFAPLPLERRQRARISYGLPSPADTITSLRAELVERLRKSTRDDKYNYAADWDVESETSEVETHSELTTGAPPTPTSIASTDDHAPTRQPSVAPQPPDNEVEYDGSLCVGGEWTSLRSDERAAASFARTWGPTWADEQPQLPPSPTSPPRPKEDPFASIDVEALANAAVRSRFFRTIFDSSESETPQPTSQLVRSGIALSELAPAPEIKSEEAEEEEPKKSYTLPQVSVNVGFGSAVMRISVAGLRYWRELGLNPASGPKDVKAFAICAPGADNERVAKSFLTDMSEVYAAHRLGQHDVGDDDGSVVTSAMTDMSEAIDKTLLRSSDAVVYVLIPNGKLSPSYLSPLLSRRRNASIHLVPISSIHVPNLVPLAFEVYDGIDRPVERVLLQGKPLDAPTVTLPYHAFTLSTDITKPELSMSWPQRSYDVLNRWRLVHGGYGYIPALSLLLVAVVDAQGDACDIKAVKLDPGHSWSTRVERAWEAFTAFAGVAATEWRLSICSYGLMCTEELDAWRALLSGNKDPVTLLMTENPSHEEATRIRPPVSNIPPSAFANSSASIIDETLVGGFATFSHRMAVDVESTTIYPISSFLSTLTSQSGMSTSATLFHTVFDRPPSGIQCPPLAPEMHKIACLGRRRYALDGPLHLAAVGEAGKAICSLAASVGIEAGLGYGAPGPVEFTQSLTPEIEVVEKEEKAKDRSPSTSSVESVAVPLAKVTAA